MTVSVSAEKMLISTTSTPSPEKVSERKTIVYETRIDPSAIRMAGEKNKDRLFTRFLFLKPEPEEVEFVCMEKHYEPYMMIIGNYCIDYYRKCSYPLKIDKKVQQVNLLGHELKPEQPNDSSARYHNIIKLEGEERLTHQAKASLTLDRNGKDVTLEHLPTAASEKNPKKILNDFGAQEVNENTDLDAIRSRILKRPKDINRVVNELFEVNERAVIYTPRFIVRYRSLRTNQEKTMEFDGVTGTHIRRKTRHTSNQNLPIPPPPLL
jgi:hypothetical protein